MAQSIINREGPAYVTFQRRTYQRAHGKCDEAPVRRRENGFGRLFYQAMIVDPMFASLVQSWASSSNGEFTDGKVKSHQRAMEKVVRAYSGDASHLMDLSRKSIIFDTIGDLLRCLELVRSDQRVVPERIKNRLRIRYDSKDSGGYRDVAMNLRLVQTEAVQLGVHMHVVELQLILREFYSLKSNEGHARYRRFRDLRGL